MEIKRTPIEQAKFNGFIDILTSMFLIYEAKLAKDEQPQEQEQ